MPAKRMFLKIDKIFEIKNKMNKRTFTANYAVGNKTMLLTARTELSR